MNRVWSSSAQASHHAEAHHVLIPHPPLDAGAARRRPECGRGRRHAGFVNYPTEWWHWSFGERYWAFITRARYARYGIVEHLPVASR
nr:M15 family metallopeptidase [Nonomuraea candida]